MSVGVVRRCCFHKVNQQIQNINKKTHNIITSINDFDVDIQRHLLIDYCNIQTQNLCDLCAVIENQISLTFIRSNY